MLDCYFKLKVLWTSYYFIGTRASHTVPSLLGRRFHPFYFRYRGRETPQHCCNICGFPSALLPSHSLVFLCGARAWTWLPVVKYSLYHWTISQPMNLISNSSKYLMVWLYHNLCNYSLIFGDRIFSNFCCYKYCWSIIPFPVSLFHSWLS